MALAHPVLPNATFKIWTQLGQSGALAEARIDQLSWGQMPADTRIGEPSAVFPRVEKKEALERILTMEQDMLSQKHTAAGAAAAQSSKAASGAVSAASSGNFSRSVGGNFCIEN